MKSGASGAGAVLLIFGPPGVGKGTQAVGVAEGRGLRYVGTGNLLRQAVRDDTPLGRQAQGFMRAGQLVPDEVVLGMVAEALGAGRDPVLLDGFPRTVPQADALAALLGRCARRVDAVLVLDAGRETLVARISGRRTCSVCQTSFHVVASPPREAGVCDRCGGRLVQRPDDHEDAVRQRLVEYTERTEPLISHFRILGWPVKVVNGEGSIGEVRSAIEAALGHG